MDGMNREAWSALGTLELDKQTHMFVGGSAHADQTHVETGQAHHWDEHYNSYNHQHKPVDSQGTTPHSVSTAANILLSNDCRILHNDSGELIFVNNDGQHCPRKATQDEESQGSDKEEEVLVVPPTNTVVHPWTVVVKVL